MPMEALVNPDTGDVIVVKPWGSVWGRCEVNAVVLLDDPALEEELAASGGEHLVYPYAAWEEIEHSAGESVVKHRELREASLVKLAVANAEGMKAVSAKPGILRARDADAPVALARIAEVKTPASQGKETRALIVPQRPLPEKS